MTEIIQTSKDGQTRVVLEHDVDCESPVENGDWWNVSVFYLGGRRYSPNMIALHDPEGRLSAYEHFFDALPDPDAAFIRYMSIFHGIKVHEVGVGSDGTRGLAWVEDSERERVGSTDDAENIRMSLEEYNAWARGECYGYVVQELAHWVRMGDDEIEVDSRETWEPTDDSLWGLVGYEYAEREAREALERAA